MNETVLLGVKEGRERLQNGTLTARAWVEALIQQIETKNSEVNAVLEIFADALAQADVADQRLQSGEDLPLLGVPVLLKDNILFDGHQAHSSSAILKPFEAVYSATVVERLIGAGAVIFGRTNMDEFAMGSSTESSNDGPTKNPRDLSTVPGGSSGGSAAAVSAFFAPVALGSDTGGSIRQPAALCGVVGMKPSYGRVSRFGLMALASSLDQIGPVTRSVEDAEIVYRVIAGHDERDATSSLLSVGDAVPSQLAGLRCAVVRNWLETGVDPEVHAVFEEHIEQMRSLGAIIHDVELPLSAFSLETYYTIVPAEAASNLARFDGVRFGASASGETLLESYMNTREKFGTEPKRRTMLGNFVLSAEQAGTYFEKATAMKAAITAEFAQVFESYDLLLSPTSPLLAWSLGGFEGDPLGLYAADICTVPANIAGIPAISVPIGAVNGLPVGLQLMAAAHNEHVLFAAGKAIEHARV